MEHFLNIISGGRFGVAGLAFITASIIHPNCNRPLRAIEFPYRIGKPDAEYILQQKLTEISGLSFLSDKELAVIQDEEGAVFFYDLNKETVTKKIPFSKDGDFEDLEIVGDTAYVLRSDGKIYELQHLDASEKNIVKNKYVTPLTGKNNTEGMCYDALTHSLLIACKGDPEIRPKSKELKNKKAIYSFNLTTKSLSDTPFVTIDLHAVEQMSGGIYSNVILKFISFYNHTKGADTFEPSGLAIHPFTRELYVISSVRRLLIVIDQDGKIENSIKLHQSEFRQPEGIAFDSEGNLYISNEGRGGRGNILKFNIQKNKTIPRISI